MTRLKFRINGYVSQLADQNKRLKLDFDEIFFASLLAMQVLQCIVRDHWYEGAYYRDLLKMTYNGESLDILELQKLIPKVTSLEDILFIYDGIVILSMREVTDALSEWESKYIEVAMQHVCPVCHENCNGTCILG